MFKCRKRKQLIKKLEVEQLELKNKFDWKDKRLPLEVRIKLFDKYYYWNECYHKALMKLRRNI